MKIKILKSISVKKWIGISERTIEPGKVNIISGPKGSGKTSFIEAIEYSVNGKLDGKDKRGGLKKTELIQHGEKEATLFVQLNDGLTIDRKIRSESSDYFKVSKSGEAVPSTESYLRSLFKGDIFKPGEFLKKSPEEQAAIILNMLEIPWTKENIQNWFGEIPDVNYDMHILKILKQIEDKYYKERAAINQQIDVLKAQIQGYREQLPANYNGEFWREKKVQEYYSKVTQAQEVNKKIAAAKAIVEGLESRISTIKANAETDKLTKKNAFDRQRADSREFIQFLKQKVDSAQAIVDGLSTKTENALRDIDKEMAIEIANEDTAYQKELQALKEKHFNSIKKINDNADSSKTAVKITLATEADKAKEEISKHKSSIAAKEQEIINIDTLEDQTVKSIDEKTEEQIKTVDAEAGNSKKLLEIEKGFTDEEILKLTDEAETVANMQSYLRDFDLMKDVLNNKLAPKQQQSAELTAKIEKARSLPLELLKVSKCPIDGITVDDEGMLRINGTLINGLSDGEMRDLSVKIAKHRANEGDLRVICFDGFQDLNPEEQQKIIEEAKTDGFQWFFLKTDDGDLRIEIIDTDFTSIQDKEETLK